MHDGATLAELSREFRAIAAAKAAAKAKAKRAAAKALGAKAKAKTAGRSAVQPPVQIEHVFRC